MAAQAKPKPEQGVLLVDDDASFLDEARRALHSHGITNIATLQDGGNVFQELSSGTYRVVILDWVMPGLSGADLLPEIIRQFPAIPVIIMTGVNDLENVVTCIKLGAYDYLAKPLDANRLVSIVQKAFSAEALASQNRRLTAYLQGEPLQHPEHFSGIITCNDRMQSIFKIIEAMQFSRQPVLITGETGVGKELIAKAIHATSELKGPMITVNVAGLDDHMFADTLFGHKKGAFTGASESRDGLLEQARNGTLFLDEIGELSIASQVKLLRLIQQNEYYRVGSDVLQKNTARIIAASNADFESKLAAGTFRHDLYYRISTHSLHIPPLRERREDILPLAEHYAASVAKELQREVPNFSREVRLALQHQEFPGNVRELINMINKAVTNNRSGNLHLDDFPGVSYDCDTQPNLIRRIGSNQFVLHGIFPAFPTFEEVEGLLATEAMDESKGSRSAAAELLGVSRPTLNKWLERCAQKWGADGD